MTGTDLIQRATLEELLGWRARSLALADEAREEHRRTLEKVREAMEVSTSACSSQAPFYKLFDYVKDYHDDPEKFSGKVRRDLDASMWRHLLKFSGIESLMDQEALKDFERQLSSEPPEVTADTVRATFRKFKEEAHAIFRRGLVNAFVNLDRTYRSHDGFKIGSRLVRPYALSDWGSVYESLPVLRDVDRIMHILDGRRIGEGWGSSLCAHLDRRVQHSYSTGIVPGCADTEYWHVKWFKNRNMHLYPLRKDLVRRANRLIAEHFGEALGAGPDAAGANRYYRAKPYHSEVEDFYPTPAAVSQRMVEAADLEPGMDVLEPSAGEGAIVTAIMAAGCGVPDCVEIDRDRAEVLRDMLPPGAVVNMDFLSMLPEPEYDRVLMNPPFGKGAGVQHVIHALRFLKPGGRLVAVLGSGLEYRTDGPTIELRKLIAAWNGRTTPLPPGSFRLAGTAVDTVMVTLDKPVAAAKPAALIGHAPQPTGELALWGR